MKGNTPKEEGKIDGQKIFKTRVVIVHGFFMGVWGERGEHITSKKHQEKRSSLQPLERNQVIKGDKGGRGRKLPGRGANA